LTCIRRATTGSGDDRSTSETVLWQEEQQAAGAGVTIPVEFAIPADAAPCDPGMASDRTLWRLDVTADVLGIDYAASFEVPVFRTAESTRPRTDAERAMAARFGIPAGYQQPLGSPIQVSTTRRGVEIYYPRARNPGMAAGLTVFLGIWVAAIWATVHFDAPLIFPLVFGLFGVLLLIVVLDQWLTVTRVTAGDGAVTVATGWLLPRRERTLRAAEVMEVTTRIGSEAGRTPYYDVTLVTTAGKRVAAGGGIGDKREAEWLAGVIRRAVKREQESS
jgi:hypothetical protein